MFPAATVAVAALDSQGEAGLVNLTGNVSSRLKNPAEKSLSQMQSVAAVGRGSREISLHVSSSV